MQAKSFETIFSESLSAMGGENELRKIQSIAALADCVGPRGKYVTEIHSARGDRLLFKQVSAGGDMFFGYVNGEHTWTKDEKSGQVSSLDKTHASMFRGHEFQMLALVLPERFKNPAFEGEEDFGGVRCYKIKMIDELGSPCHVFFDAGSHLWAGKVIIDPRSDKGETVRVVINEWKQIGKVKLPSKVTATDKSGDWVLNFHDIKLNRVDEKIFDIPPSIAAVKELLQLQQQGRNAHFGKDAKLLVSVFADDFINIGAGKITRPTRDQSINRLQAYFDRSEFLEWDDISPPIIRVSQDASMAYVIVHKRVRLKAKNAQGEAEEATTIFAWVETYEKQNGKWVLTAVASTNEPAAK
ncbi:MAG: YybH family protein [bacterium]